uniref:NADH-ubiquinone oxidoreductase chain 4L n=1 Tax=Sternotherus carinatus TaxID=573971 RepID=H9L9F2_9SAUR|nr:NADH dehydrogenase subunit 4L [Sternotherus carinatus]ADM94814.1 NADH dehydrogenase subunit 4L [Sternotherus carinatus]WLN41553.1 NADH dehydrogenase subunit 4L [Sternotherus carinatus]
MTPLHLTYYSAFIISITAMSLHQTYLILTLLYLESVMLSLFIALTMWTIKLQMSSFMTTPMLMLALAACEAAIGLSLLMASSRTHGSDNLLNLNLLQW